MLLLDSGDIGFFLSKKNLTQECARDPTDFGCFLDGDDIYGRFVVEMDTGFGTLESPTLAVLYVTILT